MKWWKEYFWGLMEDMTIGTMEKQKTGNKKSLATEAFSLAELVTRQIRESIMTGFFVPGQRLKEEELCQMFGISRPPIREAFKTLEANGILVHKPRRGVFVTEFTARDVEEVYTIIAMLYQKTTELAMGVITDRDVTELQNFINRMKEAVEVSPCDIQEYQIAHDSFHQILIDLADNRRIKDLEKQLRDQVFIFSYKSFQERTHLRASLDYHMRIYEAIRDGNKVLAMDLMEEHVVTAITFLVNQLMRKETE